MKLTVVVIVIFALIIALSSRLNRVSIEKVDLLNNNAILEHGGKKYLVSFVQGQKYAFDLDGKKYTILATMSNTEIFDASGKKVASLF